MAKPEQSIIISSHHDACMLGNAIREHAERVIDEYHSYYMQALNEGNKEVAAARLRMRDQATRCYRDIEAKINRVRLNFEDMMDWPPDDTTL
jgi:siroheme synthase (precorrin-2 oxidase/ferrochelatase)